MLRGQLGQHPGSPRVPDLAEDVVAGLLQLRGGQRRQQSRQQPQRLAATQPPGQAQVLAQRGGRLVRRAGGDERLVAIDREIGRQRHVTVACPPSPRSIGPKRVPSKQRGQVIALALLQRQAQGLEIPAVLAVPGGGQRLEGLAHLVGGQVAERQDQLAADARVGIIGQRQERVQDDPGRAGGCLASGFVYSTLPFSRQSRPSIRTAMLPDPRILVLQPAKRPCEASPCDRMPDPEGTRPVGSARSSRAELDPRAARRAGPPTVRSSPAAPRPAWRRSAT